MIQWILLSLLFIFSLIFFNSKHPLTMGLILLMQTTLISILTGMIYQTFWFSYILFLVFMGGLLVMFIYVTSLASNEMFTFSPKLLYMYMMMFMFCMIIGISLDKNFLLMNMNMEMNSIKNMSLIITENSIHINKLFNYPNNILTIMLMNYLLITLIMTIKITEIHKGPLRPLFN